MTQKTETVPAVRQAAARTEAANAYFGARHHMMDTTHNRRIFEAGFDQAYTLRPGHAPARLRDVAQWKLDSDLLQLIQSRRWDVRFSGYLEANAKGASVGVQILASGKQPAGPRVLGEEHADDLRGALGQAVVADGLLFAGPEDVAPARAEAPADVLCGDVLSPVSAPKTAVEPVAYAIYGIGALGKHYVADVKKWDGPNSLCDDGGLGEYWAGNTPLGALPDESTSAT